MSQVWMFPNQDRLNVTVNGRTYQGDPAVIVSATGELAGTPLQVEDVDVPILTANGMDGADRVRTDVR